VTASTAATQPTFVSHSRSPLQEIAYRQKLLLYAVLINLLCQAPILFLSLAVALFHPAASEMSSSAAGVLGLLNMSFSAWCTWKVGRALKWPWSAVVLLTLGAILPCVGMLVLLLPSFWATARLKQAGIPVGLMGVNLESVP
jgi:hypothetical protein